MSAPSGKDTGADDLLRAVHSLRSGTTNPLTPERSNRFRLERLRAADDQASQVLVADVGSNKEPIALNSLIEIDSEPEISMNVGRKHAPPAAMLASLLLAALPLVSTAQQERAPADPPQSERMHEYMQQGTERHLDHLAARLEIRASQQEAWKAFASAVRGLVPATPPEPPAKDLDAAARARRAADRAADRAKRLAQLADATAKLQQTLDPPQKEVLNEVAREFGHHMHGHGDGPWGMHGRMHPDHCDGPMREGHGPGHHGEGMHDG